MLSIYDKSTLQASIKWKIKDEDIISGKKEITYISPGGYTFETKDNKQISFDFMDSATDLDKENWIIDTNVYSLDYEHLNSCLEENGYLELIKKEHRLELFRDFKEFIEVFCLTDVNEEEVKIDIECIYFELYDPLSEKKLMLIGEYDG